MTDTATHASPMVARKHVTSLVISAVAGVFMAFLGALGTGEADFIPRLVFWLVVMESGALLGIGVATGIRAWGKLHAWPWIEGALIALFIALPLTLIVTSARSIIFSLLMPSPTGVVIMFGYVLMVSLVMVSIDYIALGRTRDLIEAQGEAATQVEVASTALVAADTRFRDRLPHHLRSAAILALESEDHYLRVHCAGGDALILVRLSDAVAELAAEDGAQTHRSWWVARAAISKVTPGEGRAILTLSNGVEAPVSRSNYQALKKSGWLA
jgi:DNA-binding LytR/AlgR family response regulator